MQSINCSCLCPFLEAVLLWLFIAKVPKQGDKGCWTFDVEQLVTGSCKLGLCSCSFFFIFTFFNKLWFLTVWERNFSCFVVVLFITLSAPRILFLLCNLSTCILLLLTGYFWEVCWSHFIYPCTGIVFWDKITICIWHTIFSWQHLLMTWPSRECVDFYTL